MRQPFPEVTAVYWGVAPIAQKWSLSEDKTTRILEQYRDAEGFHDFGRAERDTKRHVRKYSIIRISPELLARIEAEL